MRVVVRSRVFHSVWNFYEKAMDMHPALDKRVVDKKIVRMYDSLQSLKDTYFLYNSPRYNEEWQRKGYLDFICEDFHFAFQVQELPSGERIVSVEDAIHSLLFHD